MELYVSISWPCYFYFVGFILQKCYSLLPALPDLHDPFLKLAISTKQDFPPLILECRIIALSSLVASHIFTQTTQTKAWTIVLSLGRMPCDPHTTGENRRPVRSTLKTMSHFPPCIICEALMKQFLTTSQILMWYGALCSTPSE